LWGFDGKNNQDWQCNWGGDYRWRLSQGLNFSELQIPLFRRDKFGFLSNERLCVKRRNTTQGKDERKFVQHMFNGYETRESENWKKHHFARNLNTLLTFWEEISAAVDLQSFALLRANGFIGI
jgi:hypothetical protein